MDKSSRKSLHKTLFAILFGTAIEYYDIALFAFIAPMLAKVFLPNLDSTNGTMLMFITYGFAIIARPLGSYFFGKIGDKRGRLKSLYITMCSMVLISLLISVIPSYDTIGISGLVLFTTLRIVQQFFVSGHFNGGAIYCIEHAEGMYPPGLISGIYNAATVVGIVFAAFIAMLLSRYGSEYWRVGYLIGAIGGVTAFLMRGHLTETPVFLRARSQIFAKNGGDTRKTSITFSISITLVSWLFGMLYALSAKVLNVIVPEVSDFNLSVVLNINLYVIVSYFFLLAFFGYTADIFGAKNQMITASLLSIPITFWVSKFEYNSLLQVFGAKFIVIALVAMLFGPAHSYFVSELAINKRYRIISVLYSVGKVIAGFSPAIFLYFWNISNQLTYVALYISIVAIFSAFFLLQSRRKIQISNR